MVDVTVEFAYEAEQPDELTINVGDVIRNVLIVDGGWWEGELNGKKGMFPDNFVKVIKKEEKEVKKDEVKKKDVQASKRQSVRDLANKIKDSVHDGPVPFRKKDPNAKKKRAKVTFPYDPENDDELKLAVGDIVEIHKQEEEGWWEGTVNGKSGMFPSNFVEILGDGESGDSEEKAEPTPAAAAAEPDHMIKGKKVHGIGLGNIFGDGPIKLRSTAKKPVDRPQEPPKTEKRAPESPVQRRSKDTKPVEKALVRYSYQAENDDELSLTEGEILIVLDKELEDSGWYKGELNGKVGVFPDNFVELIKEERKRKSFQPVPDKAPRPVIPPTPQPKAPKKPPPPAQPPAPKITPKLPDKAPVAEHPKPEPVKEEKPAPQQPAILSKKPSHPPPPLSKKPHKPVDTPQHVKEDKDDKSKLDFEHVEPAADKLTHLTASRPRGPAKRPPSQPKYRTKYVTTNIIKEEERNGDVKDSHWLKDDKLSSSHAHVPATVVEKKEEHAHPKEKSHPLPTRPPAETSQATANLQSAIEDLRKEMMDLKTHTVSKTAFNELKSENERLKQDLDTMKTTYSRRLKDIMMEVDEEKKIRLSTQVEMERIRKLVAESHV